MPTIHLKHNHKLPQDETRVRLEAIAKDLKKEYQMDYSWNGDNLEFRRSGASGFVHLGDGFVELEIKLGMLLTPLKGRIEDTIRQDIEEKLA